MFFVILSWNKLFCFCKIKLYATYSSIRLCAPNCSLEEIRLQGGWGVVSKAITDGWKVSHWQTHAHLLTDGIIELTTESWRKVMQVEASFSEGVNWSNDFERSQFSFSYSATVFIALLRRKSITGVAVYFCRYFDSSTPTHYKRRSSLMSVWYGNIICYKLQSNLTFLTCCWS